MRRGVEAGFTLLELLVGVVVLGLILAGLTQGTLFGLRATGTQARLIDAKGDMDAVDRALRRLITRADPGTAHDGPTLHGAGARLAFVSVLPEAVGGSPDQPADIALGLDGGHRLVLRWRPHLHADPSGPPLPPQETELLEGVDRVAFAYWRDGWRDTWEEAQLPALVRIRIGFSPQDGRHWPDIVVAPVRQRWH